MSVIARSTNQGVVFSPVSEARDVGNSAAVSRISEAIRRGEMHPADVLIGLGKELDEFDAFGIFTRFYGRAMKFVGPGVVVVLSVVSILIVLTRLAAWGKEAISWIQKIVKEYWPLFALGGAAAGGLYAWNRFGDEEERDAEEVLQRVGVSALRGFFLGLLPAPLAAVTNVIIEEAEQIFGTVARRAEGLQQVAGAPARAAAALGTTGQGLPPAARAAVAVPTAAGILSGAVASGLEKLIGSALEPRKDDDDEELGLTLSEEEALTDLYSALHDGNV